MKKPEMKRFFVRQRAYLDGYICEIIDGHTNEVKYETTNYDLTHAICEKLNNA